MRDKNKEKKKESAMTHESTASITRERKREDTKKRRRLERKKDEHFGSVWIEFIVAEIEN